LHKRRPSNGRDGCAPWKGDAFQWVKVPPGNRSSRKQPHAHCGREVGFEVGLLCTRTSDRSCWTCAAATGPSPASTTRWRHSRPPIACSRPCRKRGRRDPGHHPDPCGLEGRFGVRHHGRPQIVPAVGGLADRRAHSTRPALLGHNDLPNLGDRNERVCARPRNSAGRCRL
jgi:hypothetical protein